MNTSVRTRHAARGFSMVELLITIIIAGIVFAGMVPLFVTVLGKNADDNMRNISAFLAQDKVERLRQLDYMEITPTNLNSSTFKSGQFGNTVPYQTGAGTKNFTVSYSVATLPSDATSLTEQYKEVAVDVYWIGPPLPVKHVYQVARIYRQYAGPSVSLGITPAPDANGAIFDPASPNYVKLTATVPEAWRGITNGVPATSKVTFTIARDGMVGDSAGDSQDVLTSDITTKTNGKFNTYRYVGLGVYEFTWVGAAIAPLDLYKFTVVAYASDAGSAGEETGLYASLESNTPDPPTGLVAVPGPRPRQVSLEWNPCPDAFFDHFEVYRSLVSNSFGTTPLVTITENENPTYVDDIGQTLTAGTMYYYRLKVVTKKGATFYSSLPCAQV
ncbi:MAG: type II secretion system protein, partial [candidate division NC10 bacterium]